MLAEDCLLALRDGDPVSVRHGGPALSVPEFPSRLRNVTLPSAVEVDMDGNAVEVVCSCRSGRSRMTDADSSNDKDKEVLCCITTDQEDDDIKMGWWYAS